MSSRDLKDVFRQYDQNGDGTISPEELKAVLLAIGGGFTDDEIGTVFRSMDCNRDGKVQFEEFVDWLTNDQASFTDLCSTVEPEGNRHGKIQSALRKGLPEGVRAALSDDVALADLQDLAISFTGDEPDFVDVTSRLRLLDAKALRAAYEEADLDKNGYLQLEELRRLLFPEGSGKISEQESASLAKMFAQMDKNSDGKVRCGEFVSYILASKKCLSTVASDADKRQIAAAFEKADSGRTGNLTLADFEGILGASTVEEKGMVKKAFDSVDANGDGVLSIVEFSRVYGKELLQASKVTEVTWNEVPSDDD